MYLKNIVVALALSGGLTAIAAGEALAQMQVASMSGTDWLKQIELMKPHPATPSEKPWVSAEVVKVDTAGNQITISHKAIESIAMPAMTMTFPVKDPSHLRMVKTGDKVQLRAANLAGVVSVVDLRMQH